MNQTLFRRFYEEHVWKLHIVEFYDEKMQLKKT